MPKKPIAVMEILLDVLTVVVMNVDVLEVANNISVQVVDKGHPRDGKNRKFQLITLQDEEGSQVQAVLYNNDIRLYKDSLKTFSTYLVSAISVRDTNYAYGTPINKVTWTIERDSIIKPIDKVKPPEDPLPPPT